MVDRPASSRSTCGTVHDTGERRGGGRATPCVRPRADPSHRSADSRPLGSTAQRCRRPATVRRSSPAFSRTCRCLLTATTDIASGLASWLTVSGPPASRRRRSRRVPLESAWKTGSSSRSLTIRLIILPGTGLTTSVLGPQVQLDEQNRLPDPPIRQDQDRSKSFT
jgi:hypothetical protein